MVKPGSIATKECRRCKHTKSLDDFGPAKGMKDGKSSWCRSCRAKLEAERRRRKPEECREACRKRHRDDPLKKKAYNLKSWYGLELEEFNRMKEDQGGVCKICGDTCSTGRELSVDHSHKTGKVRGLLCLACNTTLGKMKDSPSLLRMAADYLESSNGVH